MSNNNSRDDRYTLPEDIKKDIQHNTDCINALTGKNVTYASGFRDGQESERRKYDSELKRKQDRLVELEKRIEYLKSQQHGFSYGLWLSGDTKENNRR